MIKAVLFDSDGVILQKRKKHFSQRLKEDYGIDIPKSFFKKIYPKIRIGQVDLKNELAKGMKQWGWQKSVEELLNYWFSVENRTDNQILNLVRKLRLKGIKCYLASDNSKYRANDVMKNVLSGYFDRGFFSCFLGHTKEEKEFFRIVLKEIGLKPEEVLFIDDEKENAEVAESIGLMSFVYENFEDLEKGLSGFIK